MARPTGRAGGRKTRQRLAVLEIQRNGDGGVLVAGVERADRKSVVTLIGLAYCRS
jgi:hypothetical protein